MSGNTGEGFYCLRNSEGRSFQTLRRSVVYGLDGELEMRIYCMVDGMSEICVQVWWADWQR